MKPTIQVHDKFFSLLISRDQIERAVAREAAKITHDYAHTQPLFVTVLKGAMIFTADLIRQVRVQSTLEAIAAKSYGSRLESSGTVTLVNALPDVRDRDVILVEDIVDTGLTLYTIIEALQEQNPRSVAIAAFIDKPTMHTVTVPVNYCCFTLESGFLVGYGLDYAEHGRHYADVYERVLTSADARI